MIEGLDGCYRAVATEVISRIAGPWVRAWVEIMVFKDSVDMHTIYYRSREDEASGITSGFSSSRSLREGLLQVRELFRKGGKDVWGRAVFELEPTGRFRMNFDYESTGPDGFARYDHDTYVKWGSGKIQWYQPPKSEPGT